MHDRDWPLWTPKVKKGQLLRLKGYCGFSNAISGPGHRSLSLDKGDIVMFLGLEYRDWSMTGGDRGAMCHERRDYRMKILHGDKVWQTGIIIVEGSFSGFDMKFEVLKNTNKNE
jgi:hypothetical protein